MSTFGNTCSDRSSILSTGAATTFDTTNPSEFSGTLTDVCINMQSVGVGATGKVKVFRLNGSNYDFIGESGSQALSTGTNTFSGLNISINVGDYIGLWTSDVSNDNIETDYNVGGIQKQNGDITTNTPTIDWTSATRIISILATYIIISGEKYVTLIGNDSNSGNTLVSAYLNLYKGITNINSGGILHIGFGDFSTQTSFQINKTMSWVFDTSGGIGIISFPATV